MQIIISLYRRDMWPVGLQLMIIITMIINNIDSPVDRYIWLEIYSTESFKKWETQAKGDMLKCLSFNIIEMFCHYVHCC